MGVVPKEYVGIAIGISTSVTLFTAASIPIDGGAMFMLPSAAIAAGMGCVMRSSLDTCTLCALIPLTCMAGAFELAMLAAPGLVSDAVQLLFCLSAALLVGLSVKPEDQQTLMYMALGAGTM